jgi:two-component system C4-dicarboxylate transport response regulator DctD
LNPKKKTVLLVEDDTRLRRLMARNLTARGLQVIEAESAAVAFNLAFGLQGAINLAIVDMVMPGMSGLDLAAVLGRTYPEIKILYISGHGTSLAIEAISEYAPEAVLIKPFTQQALADKVEELLRASRWEPASK